MLFIYFQKTTEHALIVLLVVILLLTSISILIQLPPVQTRLVNFAAETLTEQTGAEVEVGAVDFDFFSKLVLLDVLMKGQETDTIIYAHRLTAEISKLLLRKRKIEMGLLELDNVQFHLKKSGEGMNINFASSEKPDEAEKLTGKSWDFQVNALALTDVQFSYFDSVSMTLVDVQVPKLDVKMNRLETTGPVFDVRNVLLEGADISVEIYASLDTTTEEDTFHVVHLNTTGLRVIADYARLNNCRFTYDDFRKEKIEKGLDYNHLEVLDINMEIQNGRFLHDTIRADFNSMTCREQSGLEIISLIAKAEMTPYNIVCRKLNLVTPKSHVRDHFEMDFNSLLDFYDFVNSVNMKAELKDAKIAMQDINYFAHALDVIEDETIEMDGTITGTVSGIRARNLTFRAGERSVFEGRLDLYGLPNLQETFIDFKANRVSTTAGDLKQFYPPIVFSNDLYKLGNMTFTGNFIGFYYDFVAFGDLTTNLGSIASDVNFKVDQQTLTPAYSGHIAMDGFDLGKFWEQEENIGKLTLQTAIEGKGIKLKELQAELDGSVESFTLLGHEYNGIKIDGRFEERMLFSRA